jgi:hypothetical protein
VSYLLSLRFNFPSWNKRRKKEEEEEAHKQVKKSIQFNYMIATFQDPEKLKAKNKAKISIT